MENIYKSRLIDWTILLSAICCLTTFSCVDDDRARDAFPEMTDATTVQIVIHTPGNSLPQQTRSQDPEYAVKTVKVLVLEKNNESYNYKYMVDGEKVAPVVDNPQQSTFTAKLTSTANPLKLLLVANSNNVFLQHTVHSGMSETEIREMLVDEYPYATERGIPMYGETTLSKLEVENNEDISITMLRSVARVDVVNEVDDIFSDPFTLGEVYFFRANDKIQLIPDASSLVNSSRMLVSEASVPSDAVAMTDFVKFPLKNTADTAIIMNYIPESLPLSDGESVIRTPTCVIVGGYYNGDSQLSYYRIDFDSKAEGHPFGQILRNHKYVFKIKQVNGRGWSTPAEAAENEAQIIVARIEVWEENTSKMYFNSTHYIGISSKESVLFYQSGNIDTLYIQSDIPFNVQWTDGSGTSISASGGVIENDYFSVQLEKNGDDPEDVYRVYVTTLTRNEEPAPLVSNFTVTSDFCEFNVNITQKNTGSFADRYIRVLSTGTWGALGDTWGASGSTSGTACRNVMDNPINFSPTGTVSIAGFIIHKIDESSSSSGLGMTNKASVDAFRRMLEEIDVVHFSYLSAPSVAISEAVLDWLDASPHRVLLVDCENSSVNTNLRNILASQEDGLVFKSEHSSHDRNTCYILAELNDKNRPFLHGPFGKVERGDPENPTLMGYGDTVFEVCYEWNEEKHICLLTTGGNVTTGSLIIHPARNIVYIGECQIFCTIGKTMSNTLGNVDTDFDRLMANLWAWIVDRVCLGK